MNGSREPWVAGVLAMCVLVSASVSAAAEHVGPAALADEIVRSAGVKAGLCVHLGCGDGTLTAALARSGRFLVHGVTEDAAAVKTARAFIQRQGLYGKVSVERCAYRRLPYAENLVNLIVVDDVPGLLAKGLSFRDVMRVLCPGGVAYVGAPADRLTADTLKTTLADAGVSDFEIVERAGVWARIRKPRPAEMDDWTHWRYGPAGNAVSRDTLVGVPRHLRWIAGPTWSRSHGLPGSLKAAVSADDRLFCVYDEAPTSVEGPWRLALIARDAHNGLPLWKRPVVSAYAAGSLKGKPFRFPKPVLVAGTDRVWTVLEPNGRLVAIEAATGRTVRTYDNAGSPRQVVHLAGTLVLSEKQAVRALDAATGEVLWRHNEPAYGTLVVGAGHVFFQSPWGTLVCLDAGTRAVKWRRVINTPGRDGSITKRRLHLCFHQRGLLVFGEGYAGRATYGFSAENGAFLWRHEYHPVYQTTDVYFQNDLVWIHGKEGDATKRWFSAGLDPRTGEAKRRIDWPAEYAKRTGHHRCYPNRASARYALLGSRNIDFVDWQAGKTDDIRTARGDCAFGVLPANGLIYAPPHPCTCDNSVHLRGFLALAPARDGEAETAPAAFAGHIEKGPAFGDVPHVAAARDDWPTYRHDGWRSGSTSAVIPADLKPLWQASVGGRPTSPTVAAGRVFVAAPDAHRVLAFDATTGARQWAFTAAGRVDSPPTFHKGLVLFGCRDGWVYCLRARDGALVWRLRAAPAEKRIVAFGQLESAWPVHGTVLVKDGLAHVAVGRAANLGGLAVCAVDPFTGTVAWRKPAGGVGDILSTDNRDQYVHLRRNVFEPRTGTKPPYSVGRPIWAGTGFLDPSWPSRARWRFWYTTAEMIVYDAHHTYGVQAFYGYAKNARTKPGNNEYTLFCRKRVGRKEEAVWSVKVPVRMTALLLAGKTLFVAGPPDVADTDDPWAAFDGRKGGELRAFSATDGKELSTRKLSAPPVYDGLAAAGFTGSSSSAGFAGPSSSAGGRLYLSTRDGTLLCFGEK